MFYGITDLATFVLGTIFIVLLPGPNSLYVMGVASRHGIAAGYRGAMGIFAGDTVLMLLSTAGAASLLRSTPWAFMVIKYVGAAYLSWLGLGLARVAWRRWHGGGHEPSPDSSSNIPLTPSSATASKTNAGVGRPFHTALLISVMNPKAILFFVSFFIQFVDPAYAYPVLSFALLGLIVQFFSALYLSALIFGGSRLAQQFGRYRRVSALGMGAMGLLFIGFGLRLASTSLG